jgi:hypothetical protein
MTGLPADSLMLIPAPGGFQLSEKSGNIDPLDRELYG